jgi:hypothetical protein
MDVPVPLTASEIRRVLLTLRKEWAKHDPFNPFYLSSSVTQHDMSVAEFCTRTVLLQRKIQGPVNTLGGNSTRRRKAT